jgi:hypothetical protein
MTTVLLPLLLMFSAQTTTQQKCVAMVLEVTGAAQIKKGADAPSRLAAMDLVYADQQIITPAGGKVLLVFLGDQQLEEVQPSTTAIIAKDKCTPDGAAKRLDAKQSPLVIDRLQELHRSGKAATAVFRGTASVKPSDKLIIPIPEATVLSQKPDLTWPKWPNAKQYRVELMAGGSGRLLWRRENLDATKNTLAYPEQEKELTRGRVFRWRVYVEDDKGDVHEVLAAEFLVASQSQHAELQQLAPLIAPDASVPNLVLAALAYERERASQEALGIYERLVKLAPYEVAFQTACAQLYESAGRLEEAKKAWAEAEKCGYVPRK